MLSTIISEMATKGSAHSYSAADSLRVFRDFLLVLVAYVPLVQAAKPTLHAAFPGDTKVELTCSGVVDVVQNARFIFGEPTSAYSVVTGDGSILTVVVTPENETKVRCQETGGEESDVLYLFAPRQGSSPSPSCSKYDYENNILEFHCEHKPGRLSEYYQFVWRNVLANGVGTTVSYSLGFSADTDDFSLRVNLSTVNISGSFQCLVDVPQCVMSLVSPDNISDNCGYLNFQGMLQKVPPNYSTLLSARSLNTASAVEGVPVSISCMANTTGFLNITFKWTVGGGLPIHCSDYDNCSINDGVESVLTRTYDPGLISVSCTVLATDNTGTGGCVEATRTSILNITDVNECLLDLATCHMDATCINTNGSFLCLCNGGFAGDGIDCTDVDECLEDLDECHLNAICINTNGSFLCLCNDGFTGDGISCTDLDECRFVSATCHSEAVCINMIGFFFCHCNVGFAGDGFNCTDVDECLLDLATCHLNATCINTNGGFLCICNDGFAGDGSDCTDVDECVLDLDTCHLNATCINTNGSFLCLYNDGFSGDGIDCTACADGDVQLMNGNESSTTEGRVEVCFNNTYGTVCDDYWDELEAKVTCRRLNLTSGYAVPMYGAVFGEGKGDIILDNLLCLGNESSLLECHAGIGGIGIHNCNHSEDAGVRCEALTICSEESVRLIPTKDRPSLTFLQNEDDRKEYPDYYFYKDEPRVGRVEVCVGGAWGTVCDDSWDNRDASVVCSQLGFSRYGAVGRRGLFITSATLPALMELDCVGNETEILSCSYTVGSSCDLLNVAHAVCQAPAIVLDTSQCSDGDTRLISEDGNETLSQGRVELCISGAWGGVCDSLFDSRDAAVVCGKLGFINGGFETYIYEGDPGSRPLYLSGVNCEGTENSLLECQFIVGSGGIEGLGLVDPAQCSGRAAVICESSLMEMFTSTSTSTSTSSLPLTSTSTSNSSLPPNSTSTSTYPPPPTSTSTPPPTSTSTSTYPPPPTSTSTSSLPPISTSTSTSTSTYSPPPTPSVSLHLIMVISPAYYAWAPPLAVLLVILVAVAVVTVVWITLKRRREKFCFDGSHEQPFTFQTLSPCPSPTLIGRAEPGLDSQSQQCLESGI